MQSVWIAYVWIKSLVRFSYRINSWPDYLREKHKCAVAVT